MATFEYIGIEPFQPELNRVLLGAVKNRISAALDVHDQPARALTRGYARAKQRHGLIPRRNWIFTGQLLGAMTTMRSEAGQLVIGFNNAAAARKAAINNARVEQWGLSPRDRAVVEGAINEIRNELVRVA